MLAVGDLAFIGDESFVNVCRPVLIGREVFLTMRAMIVTHNIGHSVLEGFENRFAPVVLEDRLAGRPRHGRLRGLPRRRGGDRRVELVRRRRRSRRARSRSACLRRSPAARSTSSRARARSSSARRMIDDLHELLALRGHEISAVEDDGDARRFDLAHDGRVARILFRPAVTDVPERAAADEVICLTLDARVSELPAGVSVRHVSRDVLDDGPFEVRGAKVQAKVPAPERLVARVHQVWSVTRV